MAKFRYNASYSTLSISKCYRSASFLKPDPDPDVHQSESRFRFRILVLPRDLEPWRLTLEPVRLTPEPWRLTLEPGAAYLNHLRIRIRIKVTCWMIWIRMEVKRRILIFLDGSATLVLATHEYKDLVSLRIYKSIQCQHPKWQIGQKGPALTVTVCIAGNRT